MPFTKDFKKLGKGDVAIAGGKGASLGEMTQAGIPVPEGFVVLSEAFEKFIEKTDLNVEIDSILDTVKHDEIHTVEEASEKIQALILSKEMPSEIEKEIEDDFEKLGSEYVAVRSSATSEDSASAAWAGQLDSFLNTTKENLLENVKRCWASLFTPRAIFYRFEKGLHGTEISVAVVVQKMINSEESGIAFSVHPVTEDYNQIIIEAGFGLGEAIVSGQITPDSYVVDKEDWHIIDINVSEQEKGLFRKEGGGNEWKELGDKGKSQVLNEKEIIELSKLIVKIENHYGFPCDIEWAKEKGRFYITQSRPITTLTKKEESEKTLVNIFSREKSLIYFSVWDDSDRKGMEMIGEEIKNNLFIIPEEGKKGSVWYEEKELSELKRRLIARLASSKGNLLWKEIKKLSEKSWKFIEPYAKEEIEISSNKELKEYYDNLVDFWVCLNSILYEVLDDTKIDKEIRNYLESFRSKTEKYTEKMSSILSDYLKKQEKLKEISNIVTIKEVLSILNKKITEEELNEVKKRKNGCFMLNQKIYPYEDLSYVLKSHKLKFEKTEIESNEFFGEPAFGGLARGTVKIVDGFKDLAKISEGDVLVTQMTNPEYFSSIKKAAAVITDQGGTLCHAAITARELKKPCVIATKIATKVLKDGDLVEIDADKGAIKIIREESEKTLVKQFKKKIGKDELLVIRGKFIPLFLITDWLKFYDENFRNKEDIYPVLSIKKGDLFSHYISLDKYLEVSRKAIERYIRDPKYADKIKEKYQEIKEEINSFYLEYFRKKPSTEKELLNILKKSEYCLHELVATTLFIDFLDAEIVKKTYKEAGLKINFDKVFEVSEILDFPSFDLKNNLELIKESKNNKEYLKHVYTGYSAAPTKEEVEKKLDNLDLKEIKEEVKLAEQQIKKKSEEKKKLRNQLNQEEKLVADFLSWATELRDDRKPLMNKIDVLFNESIRELYERWGIKKELSLNSYVFEVLKGKGFSLENIENVKKRQKDFVNVYYGNNEYSEKYEGLEEEFKDAETLEKPRDDIKNIKGQIANKGKIKGIARVIFDPKKFHSFTEGDILVTSMTRPEFIPVMKKSSAIVTNEGGIACHAAIVARELNKPCVIGTKNATEIIRDGDEIEVDADNGVVKILNGNKTKLSQFNPEDYVRMFSADAFAFLFSDIFLQHYGDLGVLSLQNYKYWISFFPKSSKVKTLEEGLKLYTNKKVFDKYNKDFHDYIKESSRYFESTLKKEKISASEIRKFLELAAKHFSYYSKTEFFYTDSVNPDKMAITVQQFDKLKLDGRAYLNKILFMSDGYLKSLIKKISEQTGVNQEELLFYWTDELVNLIETGKKLEGDEVKERHLFFHSKDKTLFGEESKETVEHFFLKYMELSNVINGTIANKGIARGKARVLAVNFNKFDETALIVKKMQKGEILFAETTAPEIVAACHKAAAIVTNQGGMLSHAAIISRELNIPCIIGADKNVLLNIKTGDLVEVDANKGIVKILQGEEEIRPEKYLFMEHVPGGYPMDVAYINLAHVMGPQFRESLGIESAGSLLIVFENGEYDLYFEEKPWQNTGEKIIQHILHDESALDKLSLNLPVWIKELLDYSLKFKEINYGDLTNEQLIETLNEIINIEKTNGVEAVDIVAINYGTGLLLKELKKVLEELGYKSAVTSPILLRATGEFDLLAYEESFGQLALFCLEQGISSLSVKDLEKYPDVKKRIESLQERYAWLDAGITAPAKSKESIVADVNSLLSFGDELPGIIKKREERKSKEKQEKQNLMEEIYEKANDLQRRTIKLAIESSELGRQLVDAIMQFIFYRRDIYSEIAKRLKITKDQTKLLLLDEIISCLSQSKKPNMEMIRNREKLAVCYLHDNKVDIFSGERALELKTSLDNLRKEDNTPMKGEIAFSKGKVKGIAKLVNDASDMEKVKEGDILVSSRTYPDLLPAMKRSSAIISELGGLLSHAAIVSRELHIPCLVGVRGAMKKIKEGDLIEVDTEEGTIKIIND